MSSGSRVECVRGEGFALLRLRRLPFAFFEIAIELLDQVQDGRRLTLIVGDWWRFPSLALAVMPHGPQFLPVSIVLPNCTKSLTCDTSVLLGLKTKQLLIVVPAICYFSARHVRFSGALDRIGRPRHLASTASNLRKFSTRLSPA